MAWGGYGSLNGRAVVGRWARWKGVVWFVSGSCRWTFRTWGGMSDLLVQYESFAGRVMRRTHLLVQERRSGTGHRTIYPRVSAKKASARRYFAGVLTKIFGPRRPSWQRRASIAIFFVSYISYSLPHLPLKSYVIAA